MNNTGQTGGTPDADIDAPEAWNIETGSSNVVVDVTDTGVDFSHPDLAAQQWINAGENCGSTDPTIVCAQRTNGVDDDGNGYVDDYRGWDFVNNDNNPFDDNSHGTHVSGTIGAVGNNGVGVVGVNWNVKIMALKFLNASGNGSTADAISATLYAANKGAAVSNNSWGGGGCRPVAPRRDRVRGEPRDALRRGRREQRGEQRQRSPFYPASYNSDVIASIAATDHNDARSSFSNYGATTVDLGAPGTSILSTIPGGGYALFNGTSMATPHVSGAAALLKAHFPSATAYGLKALLMRSVDPKASMQGITVTGGRLNVFNAVSCVNAPKAVLLTPLNGFSVLTGQPIAIRMFGANCASPAGLGNVSVNVNGTPVTMTAASPDNGRYSGTYTPTSGGPLVVTATVTISGNSDVATATGTASGGNSGPYTCQDVSDGFVDATGGTLLPLTVDDGFTTVNLPFSFPYFSSTHTQAFVSSNGFLTLGSSSGANTANNAAIPNTANPNGVIAPFWDDLNPKLGGAVYTNVTGSAPNRIFTVEWFNVPHFNNVGAGTFEASLYETSGLIRFRYLDTDFGNAAFNAGALRDGRSREPERHARHAVLAQQRRPHERQGDQLQPGLAASAAAAQHHDDEPAGRDGQPGVLAVRDGDGRHDALQLERRLREPAAGPQPEPDRDAERDHLGDADDRRDLQLHGPGHRQRGRRRTRRRSRSPSAPAAALTITTTSLPGGTVNQAYSQPVTATGGTTPYSWAVVSGSLPPGLSLSPTGTPSATISGTPTTAGTYNFTVQVTDNAAQTDTQDALDHDRAARPR